jgi:Stress responsive A/B Barrel Domain
MSFRHVVLFRVHDGVSNERIAAAIGELEALGALPGVTAMRIERSLDGRKGRIIVEDATFSDAAAFAAFRASPPHLAVGREMAEISDWWVGDYES